MGSEIGGYIHRVALRNESGDMGLAKTAGMARLPLVTGNQDVLGAVLAKAPP